MNVKFFFLFFIFTIVCLAEEGFVKIKDGCMYYQEFGQGYPIIVVHGGPGLDQGYLQPKLLELAADYRLIFYDQRGSGKSLESNLDEEHINVRQFVEDLEALRKALCLDKCILMGHSWGGFLVLNYAIDYPEHVSGMILLNTTPADYKGKKAFLDEFAARTKNLQNELKPFSSYEEFKKLNKEQISLLYEKLFSVYFYDPRKVQDLCLDLNLESAQSGYLVMQKMEKSSRLQPSVNLFPKLKCLEVPTYLIHGREDIVPAWTALEIRKAMPHAEIVLLDQCGHFPYIEQPCLLFTHLQIFLKNSSSPIRDDQFLY